MGFFLVEKFLKKHIPRGFSFKALREKSRYEMLRVLKVLKKLLWTVYC